MREHLTQGEYDSYFRNFAVRKLEDIAHHQFGQNEVNLVGKVPYSQRAVFAPCLHGQIYMDMPTEPTYTTEKFTTVHLDKDFRYMIPDTLMNTEHMVSLRVGICEDCGLVYGAYSISK